MKSLQICGRKPAGSLSGNLICADVIVLNWLILIIIYNVDRHIDRIRFTEHTFPLNISDSAADITEVFTDN